MLVKPVSEVIQSRTSWRTYTGEKLFEEDRHTLLLYIGSDLEPLFGSESRFMLIDKDSGTQKLGTYGFIKGARHFILGAIKPGEMNLEDYGYTMEKIILQATRMGLGTCWLGGTFNKQGFLEALKPREGESMPAITPVGYTKESRGTFDKAVRYFAGSKNRKPWSELFYKPDFTSLRREEAGVYGLALEMVRLGPSASNGQPWRLVVDGDAVHFYVQNRSGYKSMVRLDMGIAFCHFDLSVKESNLNGVWGISDPGLPSGDVSYVATWTQE